MLDNLQFDYEPNDDEEYASAYDIFLTNDTADEEYEPNDGEGEQVGLVFVRDEEFDSGGVVRLFTSSPELLSTVRRFVQWADNQPVRPRPNLDPIVADARDLLDRLDD